MGSPSPAGGSRTTPRRRRTGPTPTSPSTSPRRKPSLRTFPTLAARGLAVVIGTTGWSAHEAALRREAERVSIGVVAAPNFALGVSLFGAIAARAAELMSRRPDFGAWLHEAHHATKKDAPSGTALALEAAMRDAGYDRAGSTSRPRAPARFRNAHDWLRRRRRNDYPDAHGPGSVHLRPRRPRGGPAGCTAGRAGSRCRTFSGS